MNKDNGVSSGPGGFLDAFQGTVGTMSGHLMIAIGVIGLIWAGMLIVKKLMSPDGYGGSWAAALMMLLIGGALSSGGALLTSGALSKEPGEQQASSRPTASPPTSHPAETAPPPKPKSEPFSLPEISNPGAMWTWIAVIAAGIALLIVLYFFVRKVHRDRLRAAQEAKEIAEAEAEAQRLAEEKAAREKAAAEKKARIRARWTTIVDLHEELKRRVAEAETDWDTLFDLPALTDVSYRQTRALHRAMRDAENAVSPMPPGFDEQTQMERIPYVKKVHAFENAWNAAVANAKKVGTSKLPDEERKTIKSIRRLLLMAEGNGATPNERHTAYEQIRKLLSKLRVVQVPQRTLLAVESTQRLALPSAQSVVDAAHGAKRAKEPFRL